MEELAAMQSTDIGDDGTWKAVRLPISDGFHTLSCPEEPERNCAEPGADCCCSVMVHGYDQYISYGYPAGLNLDDAE